MPIVYVYGIPPETVVNIETLLETPDVAPTTTTAEVIDDPPI